MRFPQSSGHAGNEILGSARSGNDGGNDTEIDGSARLGNDTPGMGGG
jgi:hypothetical protein